MKACSSGNLRYMADRFFEKACIREVFILNDRPLKKKVDVTWRCTLVSLNDRTLIAASKATTVDGVFKGIRS